MNKVLWTILLVLVLATAGCSTLSENSPTGPGDTGEATTSTDTYAEALILADQGGILRLGANSLYFPPNALAEDTLITMVKDGNGTPFSLGFDLHPDGIQFQKPVTLTLEMARQGITSAGGFTRLPQIFYYNEDTSKWEGIGGQLDFSRRVIRKNIHHFSRYGTGTPWFIFN